jgi:hypothetical protein
LKQAWERVWMDEGIHARQLWQSEWVREVKYSGRPLMTLRRLGKSKMGGGESSIWRGEVWKGENLEGGILILERNSEMWLKIEIDFYVFDIEKSWKVAERKETEDLMVRMERERWCKLEFQTDGGTDWEALKKVIGNLCFWGLRMTLACQRTTFAAGYRVYANLCHRQRSGLFPSIPDWEIYSTKFCLRKSIETSSKRSFRGLFLLERPLNATVRIFLV